MIDKLQVKIHMLNVELKGRNVLCERHCWERVTQRPLRETLLKNQIISNASRTFIASN